MLESNTLRAITTLCLILFNAAAFAVLMPDIALVNLSGNPIYYKIVFKTKNPEIAKLAYGASKKIHDVETTDLQISGTSYFSQYTGIHYILEAIKEDVKAVPLAEQTKVNQNCSVKIYVGHSDTRAWNVKYSWSGPGKLQDFCSNLKQKS